MRDALGHRGPDDSGIEVFGTAGLVHTRLAILDLSPLGHQPMRHPESGAWLVYNGEIYNHLDLRRALGGDRFTSGSDTETLLHALEAWGPVQTARRLSGQFAYAYLDRRRNTLTLTRDRFGIKPLYLAAARGAGGTQELWFASEPAALLAAGVTPAPVENAWASICSGAYLGGEPTLLRDITRVPAGANTTIDLDTLEITTERWHAPAADVDPDRAAQLQTLSRRELTDEVERVLRSSIQGAMLSDATVGTFCSGGIDSSLITALCTEVKPDIVAFGASYKGDGPDDEGLAAARVARTLGIDLELVEVTPENWRQNFVTGTIHHGSPLANASAVTVAELSARARACGVKVVMTGEGADELFAGYASQHATAVEQFLPRPQALVHWAEPKLLGDRRRFLNPSELAGRVTNVVRAVTQGKTETWQYWTDVLAPDTVNGSEEAAIRAYSHHTGERRALEAQLLSRMDFSLCWLLNRMDANVMQNSVEARVPFLEPALVELTVNLPLERRIGPWSKGILRDVARRILPLPIAHRPKIYGLDFDAGAWVQDAARPEFLRDGMLREVIDVAPDVFDRQVDTAIEALRLRLWSAEVWARATFGGQTSEQIERELWR